MHLAVGIPSLQEADSIARVVTQVDRGLADLADSAACLIVNVDSASPDGTAEVFQRTPTRCRKESVILTERPPGKGRNVLRFFQICARERIAALALVDADLRSITPKWVSALLGPILQGQVDFVAPEYQRHRFDGSTTNHFAYPFLGAYYGADLRQPIGGDFGLSARFVWYLLQQPIEEATLGYGIDIFMSSHAVGGGFRHCQVPLDRKEHKPSHGKWHSIMPAVISSAIGCARRHRYQPGVSRPPSIAENPEYPDYESLQRMLAESRAAARRHLATYCQWPGLDYPRLAAELVPEAPGVSAAVWCQLLAAGLAHALWIDREAPPHRYASALTPVLAARAISCWNQNRERPVGEFVTAIAAQTGLLAEQLRAHATRLGVAS